MAETRSPRLALPHYSEGQDSFSRLDWNEAVDRLEERAAYDDGANLTALPPVADAHPGRYTVLTHAGGGWTLYRADDDRNWLAVGGTVDPQTRSFRALQGQTRDGVAWQVQHPDGTNPGAVMRYGGSAVVSGLTVSEQNPPATGRPGGALHVGSDAAPDPENTGRAYVRTRYAGDRGLVVQSHAADAGALFTAREPGGGNMLTVDSIGRLRVRAAAALGGAELGAYAAVVAPGSTEGGLLGLLLHGQDAQPTRNALEVRRYQPGSADHDPILTAGPGGITLGRPDGAWTGAALRLAAPTIEHTGTWAQFLTAADRARTGAYREVGLDTTGLYSTAPASLSNLADPAKPPATHRAWPTAGGSYNRLAAWNLAKAGSSDVMAAQIDPQGRMTANAPWLSAATDRPAVQRDVRQGLFHHSIKRWVLPGPLYEGPLLCPGDREFTYTFPVMQLRSATEANLVWSMRLETIHFIADNYEGWDRTVLNLYFAISINGGSFQRLDPAGWEMEAVGMTTSPIAFAPGDSSTYPGYWATPLPTGATFRIRWTGRNSDGLGPIRVRRADLYVQECLLTSYSTLSEGQPYPLQSYNWGSC